MIRTLVDHGCFTLVPVAIKPEPVSADFITALMATFRQPIYVDENGADAGGPLPPDRDVGPGASIVRNAGADTGNLIVLPRIVHHEDRDVLRIIDHATSKIKF